MTGALAGRRILLGVSGGIAAYKACELARLLIRQGAQVQAVLSPRAASFVTPLSFTALTGQPCLVDEFEAQGPQGSEGAEVYAHLDLTRGIDAFVIAPASADVIGKLAHGIADSLLTTSYLSNTAPVLICPAMNVRMWQHPAVAANVAALRSRGHSIVGPESGELACGDEGPGRLSALEHIVAAVCAALEEKKPAAGPLSGQRIIVSGGATREYLDPVRFITNASSGTLALETCRALLARGASVELVHTGLEIPAELRAGLSAAPEAQTGFDLQSALSRALPGADGLVMLAAVADYAPTQYVSTKRKKVGGAWQVELHETPDVLGSLSSIRPDGLAVVGVSLEDTDWLPRAKAKAAKKNMHACLAVELGADLPFGERRLRCALVSPEAVLAPEALRSKPQAAALIADWLAARLNGGSPEAEQSGASENLILHPASKEH